MVDSDCEDILSFSIQKSGYQIDEHEHEHDAPADDNIAVRDDLPSSCGSAGRQTKKNNAATATTISSSSSTTIVDTGKGSSHDKDDDDFNEVESEFLLSEPSMKAVHGVRALLSYSAAVRTLELPVADVARFICNQGNIGSTSQLADSVDVKGDTGDECSDDDEEDDEEPAQASDDSVGLLTVVNLRQDLMFRPAMKKLKSLVKNNVKTESDSSAWREVLANPPHTTPTGTAHTTGKDSTGGLGLLLNERLPNAPASLLPAAHRALIADYEWSLTTPKCPDDERQHYRLGHLVVVGRCYLDTKSDEAGVSRGSEKKKRKSKGGAAVGVIATPLPLHDFVYPNPELEVYAKHARHVFFVASDGCEALFQSQNREKAHKLSEYTMVCLMPFAALSKISEGIEQSLGG
eukprot:Lankesteria_metandrocarpae@DN10313_c0_g1_i1.p1